MKFKSDVDVEAGLLVSGNVKMASGNAVGKFAVKSAGVHASYDFYNDGTSYFNGAVTVDAGLSQTGGADASFSGNVGIGTTNPGTRLDVNGSSIWINPADGSHAGLHFRQGGVFKGFVGYNDGTNVVNLSMDGSIANGINVNASHNVGIGTASPTHKLHVNGDTKVTGAFTATGDVTAFSDARVKENIETIPNALKKVSALRGITYNKLGESKSSMGVVAQELLEVIPEVVHENNDGMYSVAYGNIVAVLIEAMKEQQGQINDLKIKLDGFTK